MHHRKVGLDTFLWIKFGNVYVRIDVITLDLYE